MSSKNIEMSDQHFIDKCNSILELIQIHLIECQTSKEHTNIVSKLQDSQNIISEVRDIIKNKKYE